ncbi:MAG: DinB family protein [Bacteroidetes bacterium]|nr:MAG: DinB family protein [Bacteroidota bacterium]
MKKLLFLCAIVASFAFIKSGNTITDKERSYAVKLLTDTENGVFTAVKGLSDAQLKFKPAPDRWSVEDCLKHIAITEQGLWAMTDAAIKAAANPEARADIKATDEQLVTNIEDRTNKIKTAPQLEPQNTPFKSATEALNSFKENREKLITYTKSTQDDLRNHVAALPFGKFDSYQMILFIAGHSNRHTQQIEEVKADPNFPKN